jgi:hypothetical protein
VEVTSVDNRPRHAGVGVVLMRPVDAVVEVDLLAVVGEARGPATVVHFQSTVDPDSEMPLCG